MSAALVRRWRSMASEQEQAVTKVSAKSDPHNRAVTATVANMQGYAEALRRCADSLERSLARKSAKRVPCPVHDGQIHGGEAAELRAGLEEILDIPGAAHTGAVSSRAVRELLDQVDARDSLAHEERAKRAR